MDKKLQISFPTILIIESDDSIVTSSLLERFFVSFEERQSTGLNRSSSAIYKYVKFVYMCRNEATSSSPYLLLRSISQEQSTLPLAFLSEYLLKGADKRGVGLLRLEAAVEEERVLTGPPGLGVRNTPSSNTNAVVEVQAGLGDGLIVGSLGASDVELGDGDLGGNGGESLEGVGGAAGGGQVRLGACGCVSWIIPDTND